LLIFLLVINFVRFENKEKKPKLKFRFFLFITRALIILLVVAALTSPFIVRKSSSEGSPSIMLLVDNSSSMELFDVDVEKLKKDLELYVPVTRDYIGFGTNSKLGDNIFRYMHKNNLLLVTDGNNEKDSMTFKDLSAFSLKFNTSINAIKLDKGSTDVSVSLKGPPSTIVDTDYYFDVVLDNIRDDVHVIVTVDGMVIHDDTTGVDEFELSHEFSSLGHHKITVEITDEDYFDVNNKYYKVIEVVEKPKLLYYSHKNTVLDDVLPLRYDVSKVDSLPSSLNDYFAVIINDNMHTITESQSKLFESYTDDGNGLVVWGGENSFNDPSEIDLLLPVKRGISEEGESVFNFIILVDSSGYVDESITEQERVAYNLLDVLAERKETINVAILDFAHMSHVIHEFTEVSNSAAVKAAMLNFNDVTEIDGTVWYRPAAIHAGFEKAQELFEGKEGNNNVILISDGAIKAEVLEKGLNEVRVLRDKGVRVHSYSFANKKLDESILREVRKKISSVGRGLYLTKPKDLDLMFEKQLVVSDFDHFITNDLDINAVVTGYNDVVPTPSARTLITTGTGVPIITTNNYNKVAVVSTDNGELWAPEMFKDVNLAMIYRMIDWAVGDPNRMKDEYVRVEDTSVNHETIVRYKGADIPSNEKCNFFEKEDYYECKYVPLDIGFDYVLGVPFAVNYDDEFLDVGYNEEILRYLTQESSGLMFPAENIEAIVAKAKADAQVERVEKYNIDWILLAIALVIYIIEIAVRRVLENRKY